MLSRCGLRVHFDGILLFEGELQSWVNRFKPQLLGLEWGYSAGARASSDTGPIHLSMFQTGCGSHCAPPSILVNINSCDYALYMNGRLAFKARRPFANILARKSQQPAEGESPLHATSA